MTSFRDSENREWFVRVNVRTYRELKEKHDLDLMAFDTDMNDKIMDDPALIGHILYTCCEDQIKDKNLTDIQFWEGLTGDSLRDGIDCFLDGIVNFIQNPKRQDALRKMLKLIRSGEDMILTEINKEIDKLEQKMLGGLLTE